jgi:hypothetical protein
MAADWSRLREPAPAKLVAARELAHYALYRVAQAAQANVPARPDDSHTALSWDEGLHALASQPFPGGAKAGLSFAPLELIFVHDKKARLPLSGVSAAAADEWLDLALAKAGFKPASSVKLPYEITAKPFNEKDHAQELATLGRWFAAAADALAEARGRYAAFKPGAALCWPHHFDLATLVSFDATGAKSIGIGVSPGDHYYPQPYLYVSTYPAPKDPKPEPLPCGHWHTQDFFGAVATADELLAQPDPRAALLAAIDAAFQQGRRWLHV